MKKICLLFVLFISSIYIVGCKNNNILNQYGEIENANKIIAYIPLDDRPVNTSRAIYLTESAGFNLLMPEKDLYQTKLDGQILNNNGTKYGNIEKLIEWIETIDAKYYVISLDQILSGGLVNSRVMNEEDLSKTYSYIDRLFNSIKNKKVVLFDTVMRLATTVGYDGYQLDEYNYLRKYGMINRKKLNGNFSINDIYKAYNLDENGKRISTTIDTTIVDKYLNARLRKISIASYVLDEAKKYPNIYIYYGIDDSSSNNNIQTNEINFLKNKLVNGMIFPGTDELGLMSITRIIRIHYDQNIRTMIKYKATYIGGRENEIADEFDMGTLRNNVINHLTSLVVEESNCNYDLEILVLTKPKNDNDNDVSLLISKLKENILKHMPTIVIDASTTSYYGKLQKKLITDETIDLGCILSYSNWNTVGNAIGIALANGISRYLYLSCEKNKSSVADNGFIKSLVFSLVKDISYKITFKVKIDDYLSSIGYSTNNFYTLNLDIDKINKKALEIMKEVDNIFSIDNILTRINTSKYITDLVIYKEKNIPKIQINGILFPWYRTFEVDLDININI